MSVDTTTINSTPEFWKINTVDEISETKDVVRLGVKYIFPGNDKVSITFKCLPKDESLRTSLKIQQIKTSELNLPDNVSSVGEYAYDITTGMADGTFEYDVTLPKPKNTDTKISYIEKTIDQAQLEIKPEEIKTISSDKTEQQTDLVKAKDVDHFTIFIVVNPDDTSNENSVGNQDAAWVSDNNYATFNGNGDWADYAFPNLYITNGATITGIEVSVEGKTTGRDLQISLRKGTATYTSTKLADLDTAEKTIVLGGNGDLWGTTWDSGHFGDNFRVRVASATGTGTASLDMVNVKVYVNDSSIPVPVLENNASDLYALTSVSGIWTGIDGGSGHQGIGGNEIRWGTPAGDIKSGLRFSPGGAQSFNELEKIYLGTLSHLNWATDHGTAATGATLEVTLDFARPDIANQTFTYDFDIEETSNTDRLRECKYNGTDNQVSNTPCDDIITFPNSYGDHTFRIGDTEYTLVIDGFINEFPGGTSLSKFVTEEQKDNSAYLVGHLSSICYGKPAISIIKKTNGEDANELTGPFVGVGETVSWEYKVQNTGNVPLYDIVVTDDKEGVVTCPHTELAAGTSMTCTKTGVAQLGQYTNNATVNGHCALGTKVTDSDPSHYFGVKKVDICHATDSHSNPYTGAKASMTADAGGHDGHNGPVWFPGITVTWGDIIPPFDYQGGHYPGKNYDAYGQSVLVNGCTVPTGTLKVNKVAIPAGDSTQFAITGTGSSVTGAPTFMNGNTGTISSGTPHTFTVYPGTYSVSETTVTGWTEISNTCKDIVIAKGENKECTITNSKGAHLIVVKKVINDNGGTKTVNDFGINFSGGNLSFNTGTTNGSTTTYTSNQVNINPDTEYTLSETDTAGYLEGSWDCGNSNPNNPLQTLIKLSAGQNLTCTITNDDIAPIVKVIKEVINDNGGTKTSSDFTLNIGNTNFPGNENGTSFNLPAGNYSVTEPNLPQGYSLTQNNCTSISLAIGETKTCTLVNDDIAPKLTLIKNLTDIYNSGLTANNWILSATAADVGFSGITGVNQDVTAGVAYTLSETGPTGTIASQWDCNGGTQSGDTITLSLGQNIICTITNTTKPANLIIKKVLINDDGGTKTYSDFSYQVNNGFITNFESDGQNELTLSKGIYSITETLAPGYNTSYNNCDRINLNIGETQTCTITNNDIAPKLNIVKKVVPETDIGKFNLLIGSTQYATDIGHNGQTGFVAQKAGIVNFSETPGTDTDLANYTTTYSDGCANGQTTLNIGDTKTCTITNTRTTTTLQVLKNVDLNGDKDYNDPNETNATDWKWQINGQEYSTGSPAININTGTYKLTETQKPNFSFYKLSCINATVDDNQNITLTANKAAVCTFENRADTATIQIKKIINPTTDSGKFNLNLDSITRLSNATHNSLTPEITVLVGQHTVSESAKNGTDLNNYLSQISCDNGSQNQGTALNINVNKDQKILCTITNTRKSTITIKKITAPFTLFDSFNFTTNNLGNFNLRNIGSKTFIVDPNSQYTFTESTKDGWFLNQITCNDNSIINNSTVTINTVPGSNTVCTFDNRRLGAITGIKFNDLNGNNSFDILDESAINGWQIFIDTNKNGLYDVGEPSQTTRYDIWSFQLGFYFFSNLMPGSYQVCEVPQYGWHSTSGSNCQTVMVVNTGNDLKIANFANQRSFAKVTVTKFNDLNGNGRQDEAESTLPNWTINLTGQTSKVTDSTGQVIFDKILPGTYYLSENLDSGWTQTSIYCDNEITPPTPTTTRIPLTPTPTRIPLTPTFNPQIKASEVQDVTNNYRLDLTPSQSINCYIGNHQLSPELTIAKTNNVGTSILSPGNSVAYTIKLNVSQSDIANLKVTDLLSNGFKYRPGSYKITKNGTDITSQIAEPQYHSPGVWSLGSVVKDDQLELTYVADIDTNQQSGTYKDIAWAVGNNAYNQDDIVLASALPEGYLDINFVGTQVPINKPVSNSVSAEVERIQTIEGQVLGVSTDTLPATGAATIWLIIISLLGLTGLALIFNRQRTMTKKLIFSFLLAFIGYGFVVSPIQATDPSLFIRLQEPKAYINTPDLNLKFVTLDISARPITVKCFKKGPTESAFSQFGADIAVTAGGNSDQCNLASVITIPGTYQFKTEAYAGAETAVSNSVFFDYQNSTPGTPVEYSKSVLDNHCDYTIKFKTANDDGRTIKVEIYRSTNPAFSANNESLVHSINVGSDQFREVNNSVPDCSQTYYYAIRAFDTYGNGSGVIGDTLVKTVISGDTTTVTTTNSLSPAAGAVRVSDSNIPQEEVLDQGGDSDQTNQDNPSDSGEVLGTGSQTGKNYFADHKILTLIIIIACLTGIVYVIKTASKSKKV